MKLRAVPEKAWLALVSLAYVASVMIFTPLNARWAWDEAVYVSQISRHVPMQWDATRGRGIPLIDAPITLFTGSETAIRVYLTILAGSALFITLLIWARIASFTVAVIAGLLWSSIWIVEVETSQNMGNLWLAYSVAIATGLFLQYAKHISASVWTLTGLGVSSFAATMMHGPTDGAFLLSALLICLPFAEKPDRPRLAIAVLVGVGLGILEWVVEAFMYFHGPLHRLALARAEGSGFGFFLPKYITTLNAETNSLAATLWLVALLLLFGMGVYYSTRLESVLRVPVVVGAVMLAEYITFLPHPFPRYLLPTFAVWVFVAAFGLERILGFKKVVLAGVAAALVIVGMAAQYSTLNAQKLIQVGQGRLTVRTALLLKGHDIKTPCSVMGNSIGGAEAFHDWMPIAYYAGCRGSYASLHNNYSNMAKSQDVAVLLREGQPVPTQIQHWTKQAVTVAQNGQVETLIIYSKLRSAPAKGIQG
jgi:hypothetical protein